MRQAYTFGAVMTLIGAAIAGYGLWSVGQAEATADWPIVPGLVTESRVETVDGGDRAATFRPAVKYEYEVAGVGYVADQISLGWREESPAAARRAVNRYPAGAEVDVRHDPDDPGGAVLEPVVPVLSWLPVAGGAGLIGIGLLTIGLGVKYAGRSKKLKKSLALPVMGAVFLAFGLGAVVLGGGEAVKAGRSDGWPEAPGVVRLSKVTRSQSDDGDTFGAQVVFDYEVGGVTRTGDRVWFGQYGSGDRSMASGVVGKYPAGRRVSVRHDPADPWESVLEPGRGPSAWAVPAMGALFSLVGASLLFGWVWAARRT